MTTNNNANSNRIPVNFFCKLDNGIFFISTNYVVTAEMRTMLKHLVNSGIDLDIVVTEGDIERMHEQLQAEGRLVKSCANVHVRHETKHYDSRPSATDSDKEYPQNSTEATLAPDTLWCNAKIIAVANTALDLASKNDFACLLPVAMLKSAVTMTLFNKRASVWDSQQKKPVPVSLTENEAACVSYFLAKFKERYTKEWGTKCITLSPELMTYRYSHVIYKFNDDVFYMATRESITRCTKQGRVFGKSTPVTRGTKETMSPEFRKLMDTCVFHRAMR